MQNSQLDINSAFRLSIDFNCSTNEIINLYNDGQPILVEPIDTNNIWIDKNLEIPETFATVIMSVNGSCLLDYQLIDDIGTTAVKVLNVFLEQTNTMSAHRGITVYANRTYWTLINNSRVEFKLDDSLNFIIV